MSIHWIHTLFYWSLSNIACVLLQFSVGNDQRKWRQNVGHMLLFVFSGYHACTKHRIAPRLSSWLDGYPSEGVFVLSSLVPEAVSSRNDLEIEVLLIVLCSLDIMDPPTVNEASLGDLAKRYFQLLSFFPHEHVDLSESYLFHTWSDYVDQYTTGARLDILPLLLNLQVRYKYSKEIIKENTSHHQCKRPHLVSVGCSHRHHHASLPFSVHSRCFDCLNLHLPLEL